MKVIALRHSIKGRLPAAHLGFMPGPLALSRGTRVSVCIRRKSEEKKYIFAETSFPFSGMSGHGLENGGFFF